MDLTSFAAEVGARGPVTIAGSSTRGGPVPGVRVVSAPPGIGWFEPAEMTVCCGAGTPVAELQQVLAAAGQTVAIPPSGTVGGALAAGRSGIRRLGRGALRDVLLQARYVSASGEIVTAGGPTVKNVSGFDLCRLLVGSWGTLGFVGEVILRTRPRPPVSHWFSGDGDPFELLRRLYRPAAILWDGELTWVCLEGHSDDVREQASTLPGFSEVSGPPPRPPIRRSVAPGALAGLAGQRGFVAEIGVGIIHDSAECRDLGSPDGSPIDRGPPGDAALSGAGPPGVGLREASSRVGLRAAGLTASAAGAAPGTGSVAELHRRLKERFDPTGRFNPGVDPLNAGQPSERDNRASGTTEWRGDQ